MIIVPYGPRSKQEKLWDACSYGYENTAKTLIESGVNVNWKSHIYDCCLIHVASQGKVSILQMLLDAGCVVDSLDKVGNTALHHCSMSGQHENVSTLLNSGADVNACNQNGWTPLLNSVYWNHPNVTLLLLSRGANPRLRNKEGRTAVHELCRSKSRDEAGLARSLTAILNGIDGERLWSPSVPLSSTSNGEVKLSSINEVDPMLEAINERAECLNDWDSEVDFTPLLFASYHGHFRLVDLLLKFGANLNLTDRNGWTALHWAAERGHADIVEILLDRGASRYAEDVRGDRPCDVTKDVGIRDYLCPSPEYPCIVSNGYVTTDEEDEDMNDGDDDKNHFEN